MAGISSVYEVVKYEVRKGICNQRVKSFVCRIKKSVLSPESTKKTLKNPKLGVTCPDLPAISLYGGWFGREVRPSRRGYHSSSGERDPHGHFEGSKGEEVTDWGDT